MYIEIYTAVITNNTVKICTILRLKEFINPTLPDLILLSYMNCVNTLCLGLNFVIKLSNSHNIKPQLKTSWKAY